MSTVLFSKTLIEKINTIIKIFWWEATSPIAYCSWEDICTPKEEGGLGTRNLQMVNKNFVIHSAWMLPLKKNIFFFLLF
jgi:hypothetical protein